MAVFRWIVFIPIGLVVGIITGIITTFFFQILFPIWISYVLVGFGVTIAFIITGFIIVPRITKGVKWVIICIILLGVVGLIVYSVFANRTSYLIEGIMPVLITFLLASTPTSEIIEHVS